jgi:hypothetical protein
VLDAVVRTAEEQSTYGALGSILLCDEHGERLRHGAAPRLPESYSRAIDGLPIDPTAGCCGAAAYRRELVVAKDIATDPRWANYRDLALACASAPAGRRRSWTVTTGCSAPSRSITASRCLRARPTCRRLPF